MMNRNKTRSAHRIHDTLMYNNMQPAVRVKISAAASLSKDQYQIFNISF